MRETESTGSQVRPLEMAGRSARATLRTLLAEEKRIVPAMLSAAGEAKITVRPIRRNITVLEGSGGNIAVLTGRDGTLMVDAGFAVSRPGNFWRLDVDQCQSDKAPDQHPLAH